MNRHAQYAKTGATPYSRNRLKLLADHVCAFMTLNQAITHTVLTTTAILVFLSMFNPPAIPEQF